MIAVPLLPEKASGNADSNENGAVRAVKLVPPIGAAKWDSRIPVVDSVGTVKTSMIGARYRAASVPTRSKTTRYLLPEKAVEPGIGSNSIKNEDI